MEHYSPMKRNGVLVHATIWMDLENIMLSEVSKTKNKYCETKFI